MLSLKNERFPNIVIVTNRETYTKLLDGAEPDWVVVSSPAFLKVAEAGNVTMVMEKRKCLLLTDSFDDVSTFLEQRVGKMVPDDSFVSIDIGTEVVRLRGNLQTVAAELGFDNYSGMVDALEKNSELFACGANVIMDQEHKAVIRSKAKGVYTFDESAIHLKLLRYLVLNAEMPFSRWESFFALKPVSAKRFKEESGASVEGKVADSRANWKEQAKIDCSKSLSFRAFFNPCYKPTAFCNLYSFVSDSLNVSLKRKFTSA